MRTIDRKLSVGDTIQVARLEAVRVQSAGSGVRIHAVESDGDKEEYVCVKADCDGSDLGDYPPPTEVLGITEGGGMQSAQAWLLIPSEEYDA